MKKSRFLGYALTLAATLAVGSAMGQTYPDNILADYSKISADGLAADKSFVTVGGKVGFYVHPDKAFHVGYDATKNKGINAGTIWQWTIGLGVEPTGIALDGTRTGTGSPATGAENDPANFVELTAGNAAAVSKVVVKEKAASLCIDGTGTTFEVHVFPKPKIYFDQTNAVTVANATCKEITDKEVILNILAAGSINASWTLQVKQADIDAAGTGYINEDAIGSIPDETYSFSKASAGTTGIWTLTRDASFTADYTVGTWDADAAKIVVPQSATFKIKGTPTFNYQGSKDLTIYRFSFGGASDGVSDFISRKSYTATTMFKNGGTDEKFEVIIKRAPKTGPIYHIANNKYKS